MILDPELFKLLIIVPLGWSLLESIKQGRKQTTFQTSLNSLNETVLTLKIMVEDLNMKFLVFAKTETDSLKKIVEDNTAALQKISNK